MVLAAVALAWAPGAAANDRPLETSSAPPVPFPTPPPGPLDGPMEAACSFVSITQAVLTVNAGCAVRSILEMTRHLDWGRHTPGGPWGLSP